MTGDSTLTCHTTWGPIRTVLREGHVVSCVLPAVDDRDGVPEWRGSSVDQAEDANRSVMDAAEQCIRGWFDHRLRPTPPLRLPDASPFTLRVWDALRKVPWGQYVTYGELASLAGSPRACRAAGQACGANHIPLFLPCHRVLASQGRAGGFGSGLPWKRFLLAAEGLDADAITGWRS